jgi:hypothetical protein
VSDLLEEVLAVKVSYLLWRFYLLGGKARGFCALEGTEGLSAYSGALLPIRLAYREKPGKSLHSVAS